MEKFIGSSHEIKIGIACLKLVVEIITSDIIPTQKRRLIHISPNYEEKENGCVPFLQYCSHLHFSHAIFLWFCHDNWFLHFSMFWCMWINSYFLRLFSLYCSIMNNATFLFVFLFLHKRWKCNVIAFWYINPTLMHFVHLHCIRKVLYWILTRYTILT